MTTITLTNNFHNSTAKVRPDADGFLNRNQVLCARNKLCGIDDCTCGQTTLDTRGRQAVEIEEWPGDTCRLVF